MLRQNKKYVLAPEGSERQNSLQNLYFEEVYGPNVQVILQSDPVDQKDIKFANSTYLIIAPPQLNPSSIHRPNRRERRKNERA